MNLGADQTVVVIGVVAVVALALSMWNLRRQDERMRRRVAALEAEESEVRRLLDELPEAVLLVDADGVVLSTNAAALAMFDLARREFVDTHLVDQASGDDHAGWRQPSSAASAAPKSNRYRSS